MTPTDDTCPEIVEQVGWAFGVGCVVVTNRRTIHWYWMQHGRPPPMVGQQLPDSPPGKPYTSRWHDERC